MRIKVIKQNIEVLEAIISLLHIFYYNEEYKEWWKVASYTDDMDIECISSCIAEGLSNYFGGDGFEVVHDSEWHDCECCGSFTVDTTTISKGGISIEIIEDNHMGYGTRGWSDEEIIEDWKVFGHDVEIEDMK